MDVPTQEQTFGQPEPDKWEEVMALAEESAPGYDEEAAIEAAGLTPIWALPFALLFRPTRFMLSYGVHAGTGTLCMVMWIVGIAAVMDQQDGRAAMGQGSNLFQSSWGAMWGLAVFGGIFRGLLVYWLLGLWFRARLWMCGVRETRFAITGRVYAFLHLPWALVVLGYYAVSTALTADPNAYQLSEHPLLVWGGIPMVTILLWSCVMTYNAVRGTFGAERIWALIWFLILPLLVRIVALAAFGFIAWIANSGPAPVMDSPRSHRGEMIQLEYPSNWLLEPSDPDTGISLLVDLSPTGHDAIISSEIEYYDQGQEPFVETELWLDEIGFEVVSSTPAGDRWGRLIGEERVYQAENTGDRYEIRLFFSELGNGYWFAGRQFAHEDSVDALRPGFDLVRRTTTIAKLEQIPPSLDVVHRADAGTVSFDMPKNWWITRSLDEPQTGEDGSPLPRTFYLAAQAPQDSFFAAIVYNSDSTLRSELAYSLEQFEISRRLDNEQALDSWLGLEGVGITGIDRENAIPRRITIIVSQLPDGTLLEVRQIEAVETDEITAPAFEMIRSSFTVAD